MLQVLVVSPLYFAGTIELGVITQSSGAFNSILDDLSLIVNEFEALSKFSAGLGLLATFVQRVCQPLSIQRALSETVSQVSK